MGSEEGLGPFGGRLRGSFNTPRRVSCVRVMVWYWSSTLDNEIPARPPRSDRWACSRRLVSRHRPEDQLAPASVNCHPRAASPSYRLRGCLRQPIDPNPLVRAGPNSRRRDPSRLRPVPQQLVGFRTHQRSKLRLDGFMALLDLDSVQHGCMYLPGSQADTRRTRGQPVDVVVGGCVRLHSWG